MKILMAQPQTVALALQAAEETKPPAPRLRVGWSDKAWTKKHKQTIETLQKARRDVARK